MDLGLADRTVLVTGGSSGVGLATVRALLDEGARVATCGRDA
ncbi:MAG: SDR family NAD(P)-dependent oxidoreductase, partial [Streptomyces sp.]